MSNELSAEITRLLSGYARCPLCGCEDSHTDCGALVCSKCSKRCALPDYHGAISRELYRLVSEHAEAVREALALRRLVEAGVFKLLRRAPARLDAWDEIGPEPRRISGAIAAAEKESES